MTQEELDKLKGQKIGGEVVGLAENRQADEMTYGPDGRVVGGNTPEGMAAQTPVIDRGKTTNIEPAAPPLGGHTTAVFDQAGSGIVRRPDVITPDTPASPQVQPRVPGGVTNSGLNIRFAPTVSDDTRREVMQPLMPVTQEGNDARNMQHEQFLSRQGYRKGRQDGELYTKENSPEVGEKERIAYNSAILSGQNQLANTRLGGQNQLDNTVLSNTGRLAEHSANNAFTGKQNDINRAQVVEQNDMNRSHEMAKHRGDVAKSLSLAGLGGNQVQQIENSPADNINYTGVQVPIKQPATPNAYRPVTDKTTGIVNEATGEVIPIADAGIADQPKKGILGRIGGAVFGSSGDTQAPGAQMRDQELLRLQALAGKDPEKLRRLKEAAARSAAR